MNSSFTDFVRFCPYTYAHAQQFLPPLWAATKRYLLETKELRHNDGGFFISFKPPPKALTATTIARWVVNVLKEADVNVSVFSAHSTRSAASSKASDKGLNLAEISKAAGWSNAKTFAMFYKKTISENFGEAILSA